MPMAPPPSAQPSLAEALHIEHSGIPYMAYMHCLWHCPASASAGTGTLPEATATAGATAAYTTTSNVAAPKLQQTGPPKMSLIHQAPSQNFSLF